MSDSRIPFDRRAFYAAAFFSASRSGELSALRVRDYDRSVQPLARLTVGESYSVHLRKTKPTKTGVTRLVPVHPALKRVLDDWLGRGFKEAFGREPHPDDLMFPARALSRHGFDYATALAAEPALSRAELARRLGVSRPAVTQAMRRISRRPPDVTKAFRTPQGNYKMLQNDLQRLGLRRRRLHDTKRTAVSLLTEDGVRDPILTYIAWGPRNNVRDLYITLPWEVFCREMLKLNLSA
jgi:integrase